MGPLYRLFPSIGVVFYHVVTRLLATPLFLGWLWGLEEKIFDYFVDESHYLRRLARAVDFCRIQRLCEERTPDRPGGIAPVPPLKLYKLYLVMFVLRIPGERELCCRAKSDLAIRWFCGFGLLGSIPAHSTLSKFRRRMGVQTFQEAFHCILCQCVEAGLVPGQELAFDASKMLASATPVRPREQLNRLVQAFLEELFDTAHIVPDSESDEQRLAELARRAARLVGIRLKDVGRFWTRFGQWLSSPDGPQTDSPPDRQEPRRFRFPVIKPAELTERLKRVLVGLVHAVGDEDCRYGHTSDNEAFLGYLSSFAIDTAHHIITATVLDHGATHCSTPFETLYAQHEDNLKRAQAPSIPDRALGDSGYDSAAIRMRLAGDDVKVFIAPKEHRNRHGVYSTDRFRFNEGNELICPAGVAMIPGAHRERKGGTVIYRCPQPDCPQRSACTKRARRTVEINPQVHRQRQCKWDPEESVELKAAMKRRLRIEAVFGHGKTGHHLDKALYRNMEMVRIQQLMAAASMNMEKLVSARSPS
jgi:transposase